MSSSINFEKLYRQVDTKMEILTDQIQTVLFENAFPGFLRSGTYLEYTTAPEGNKAIKKIKGIVNQKLLHHLKRSYQEFDFHHLTKPEERKKYGKKFLDTLKAQGIMDNVEYNELLPSTLSVPSEEEPDPLEYRLVMYYMLPVYDENIDQVGAPKSGNKLWESYISSGDMYGSGYFYIALFLNVVATMKATKQHQGAKAALKYFRDNIYGESLTDSELLKYAENDRQVARNLKEEVKKPLDLIVFSLDRAFQEANTKSVNIYNGMTANRKKYGYKPKMNNNIKEQEIYWV